MLRKLVLISLLIFASCKEEEKINSYDDQMTEQDWQYIYNNACARMSFETKKVYIFKEVKDNIIICEPVKNEAGNFMHMNTGFTLPVEEIDETVTED